MTRNNLRKKFYLGWKLHGRIVARLAFFWAVYHVGLWQALSLRGYLERSSSLLSGRPQLAMTSYVEPCISVQGWVFLFAAVCFPIFVWDMVRFTHRIVGPLKRLEGVLKRMADGEAIRGVQLRKDDLIESFERAFNTYLASLPSPNANPTAVADSASGNAHPPVRTTAEGEHHEAPEPLDGNELAALIHEMGTIAGAVTPSHDCSGKPTCESKVGTPC